MLSQPTTKIFLKISEPRAAKWISEAIGKVERLKESRSMGLFGAKKSFTVEIAGLAHSRAESSWRIMSCP